MEKLIIETIHESLINGNRRQMVEQIKEYGEYDFFADYSNYLQDLYLDDNDEYKFFTDCVISYHRIVNQ